MKERIPATQTESFMVFCRSQKDSLRPRPQHPRLVMNQFVCLQIHANSNSIDSSHKSMHLTDLLFKLVLHSYIVPKYPPMGMAPHRHIKTVATYLLLSLSLLPLPQKLSKPHTHELLFRCNLEPKYWQCRRICTCSVRHATQTVLLVDPILG